LVAFRSPKAQLHFPHLLPHFAVLVLAQSWQRLWRKLLQTASRLPSALMMAALAMLAQAKPPPVVWLAAWMIHCLPLVLPSQRRYQVCVALLLTEAVEGPV